jgi:hypothetical protein
VLVSLTFALAAVHHRVTFCTSTRATPNFTHRTLQMLPEPSASQYPTPAFAAVDRRYPGRCRTEGYTGAVRDGACVQYGVRRTKPHAIDLHHLHARALHHRLPARGQVQRPLSRQLVAPSFVSISERQCLQLSAIINTSDAPTAATAFTPAAARAVRAST